MRPSCSTTVACSSGGREIGSTQRAWYRIIRRSRHSLVRIEQVLVVHPTMPSEGERKRDVPNLIVRVTVRAECDPDAAVDGAANESLMRPVARRHLERDARLEQRGDQTLFAVFGPELIDRQ